MAVVTARMLQKTQLAALKRWLSASLDRRSENIRVLPVIIVELELGNIERHIFAAHFTTPPPCTRHFDGLFFLSSSQSNKITSTSDDSDRLSCFAARSIAVFTAGSTRAPNGIFVISAFRAIDNASTECIHSVD
jgi:hypothetical protein